MILRADQTVEWYYDKLLKLKKQPLNRTTINLEIIIVAAETVTVMQLTKRAQHGSLKAYAWSNLT